MSSEKQIQANRINALKGGVKTAEGKAAVRLNAASHGFFSNSVLLPGEDSHLLEELREKLMNELRPEGELETILVERVVSSSWRLNRLLKAERKRRYAADYSDPCWQNYIRYETTLERQIYKALQALFSVRIVRRDEEARAGRAEVLSEMSAIKRQILTSDECD